MMSAQDNGTLTRTLYDLFEAGRFDEVMPHLTDDVEVVAYIGPGLVFRGKDGFRDFMAGWRTAFPDIRVQIENQIATDTTVVNECSATGTQTGPLVSPGGEIPATGRQVTLRFCEIWRVRDGKITGLHNYQDSGTLLTQLGVMPSAETAGV
jgi:steroid delta-isomerase-like uncharacterized protein